MLDLIRADLYRAIRPHRLRGTIWPFVIGELVFIFGLMGIVRILQSQGAIRDFAGLMQSPSYVMGQTFIAGGIILLTSAFVTLTFVLGDVSHGFIKTIVPSVRGRLAYIAEKLIFSGILLLLLLALFCLIAVAASFIYGLPFTTWDAPGAFALWFVELWLLCWVVSVIPLTFAWLTRSDLIVYGATFIAGSGALAEMVRGLGELIGARVPEFAQPLGAIFTGLAQIAPSNLLRQLAGGVGALRAPASGWLGSVPFLGESLGLATGVLSILWLALAGAVCLAIMQHRDLA